MDVYFWTYYKCGIRIFFSIIYFNSLISSLLKKKPKLFVNAQPAYSPVIETNELKTLELRVRTVQVSHTVVDLLHKIHVLHSTSVSQPS